MCKPVAAKAALQVSPLVRRESLIAASISLPAMLARISLAEAHLAVASRPASHTLLPPPDAPEWPGSPMRALLLQSVYGHPDHVRHDPEATETGTEIERKAPQ